MKKSTLLLAAGLLLAGLAALPAAAQAKNVQPAGRARKTVTIRYKKGTKSYFNEIKAAIGKGGRTIRFQPGHTYHVLGMIRVPSNTTIIAKGAKIVEDKVGTTMLRQPDNRIENDKIHGYNAVKNITIDGGTWVGTKKCLPNAHKKEGWRDGADVVNFIHAKDITIKNATFYNVYNAHVIELTGCKNCKILNCRINVKPNGKPGFYKGYFNNGGIQLDACYSSNNNPHAARFDSTACRDILIQGNIIRYTVGIECAQETTKDTKNIQVTGNTIYYHYMPCITKHTQNFVTQNNTEIPY